VMVLRLGANAPQLAALVAALKFHVLQPQACEEQCLRNPLNALSRVGHRSSLGP
jgi:hypothetical protein